jgi:hypothetical protein
LELLVSVLVDLRSDLVPQVTLVRQGLLDGCLAIDVPLQEHFLP